MFSKLGSTLREEQDCETNTRCYRREDTLESDAPGSSAVTALTCVAVLKIKISVVLINYHFVTSTVCLMGLYFTSLNICITKFLH